MAAWRRSRSGDNSEQLLRLRRNLARARERELTERQAEALRLYYDEGLTMPAIALRLGVSKSTVSRTLERGRKNLIKCLQYSL